MYLYLIRHGQAKPEDIDPERHLTEIGMLEVSEMAAFLGCGEVKVDEIWHSTKERARRTAAILSEAVPHKNLVEREGLKPNDPVIPIAEEINQIHENIMIVGHLPFLEKLASHLLTSRDKDQIVKIYEGGAVCLEKWEEGWSISWMMYPEFLAKCIKS